VDYANSACMGYLTTITSFVLSFLFTAFHDVATRVVSPPCGTTCSLIVYLSWLSVPVLLFSFPFKFKCVTVCRLMLCAAKVFLSTSVQRSGEHIWVVVLIWVGLSGTPALFNVCAYNDIHVNLQVLLIELMNESLYPEEQVYSVLFSFFSAVLSACTTN